MNTRYFFILSTMPKINKRVTRQHVTRSNYNKKNYFLHIAIAPTKQSERFENFLDKAIEIGIDRITPLSCLRSERKKLRMDRLDRVAQAALKQSINAHMPQIDELTSFADVLKIKGYDGKYIASCHEGIRVPLEKLADKNNRVLILIGPEGDFTENEIDLATKNNFENIDLGANRLRTETAGIVVCQIIKSLNRLKE